MKVLIKPLGYKLLVSNPFLCNMYLDFNGLTMLGICNNL